MSNGKVNITLSADAELVRRARDYAREHGTTLNQMIRDHMDRVTGGGSAVDAATQFSEVALHHPGRSPEGYRIDRDEIHARER